tara:strand:- start:34383 stop:36581 length:2199 start_codon:yes stop_codon:yes gene_type:complete
MAALRLKKFLYPLAIILGISLWLSILMWYSPFTQSSEGSSSALQWVLLANLAGIVCLLSLILFSLFQLFSDFRSKKPGTRLKTRMIILLVALGVTPLLIVYIFSVQFVYRGIDNWFDIDIEGGLVSALELSQNALNLQMRDHLLEAEALATDLSSIDSDQWASELGSLRSQSKASELAIFSQSNQIIAVSSNNSGLNFPSSPSDEVLLQLSQGDPYLSLEPIADGVFETLAVVNLAQQIFPSDSLILLARFPVEERLSSLAGIVGSSYEQYSEVLYLREALKTNFTVMLTVVLLITLLASVYAAFNSAKQMIAPIQRLVAGTKAVAEGKFDTKLETSNQDAIGSLIISFNDMTHRLSNAQEQANEIKLQVEEERTKLELILSRLSTGVITLEKDLRIRTANDSASSILGINLNNWIQGSIINLSKKQPLISQFVSALSSHLQRGEHEWREQVILSAEVGQRVLMVASTALSNEEDLEGYIIVFDDITTLMQAQKDAAWGEVARRLAHEIKNPLTPIQLSAEQLRRKYLDKYNHDSELLDRATHTIIQQVEAMKGMVNDFSNYAKTPDLVKKLFSLNKLVIEVTELYIQKDKKKLLNLELSEKLPNIYADEGKVRQVLHNLIRNSQEAVENQSEKNILLKTFSDRDMINLVISDNGPGFLESIADKAFDPYVTSKSEGTGLGLAIVKKIIDEHGGKITARNNKRGVEIIVALPIGEVINESFISNQGSQGSKV